MEVYTKTNPSHATNVTNVTFLQTTPTGSTAVVVLVVVVGSYPDNYLQVDTTPPPIVPSTEPLTRLAAPYTNDVNVTGASVFSISGQDNKHSAQLYLVGIQDLAGIKPDTNDL